MSVQEYIEKHELPKRVEEVINATVKAKPDEPLSYMVSPLSYFTFPSSRDSTNIILFKYMFPQIKSRSRVTCDADGN